MITLRDAGASDAAAIARVHVDTWRTTYGGIVPDDFLQRLSYERREAQWADMLKRAAPREHLIVACDAGGAVVGFTNGAANRATMPPFDGELLAIYLRREFQGQGAGRRLFESTVARLAADGFTAMMLWVLEANATCRFYERMGGRVVGEKTETIGGKPLKELAYGWTAL